MLFGLIALVVVGLSACLFLMPMLDTAICFIGDRDAFWASTMTQRSAKDYYYAYENDAQMLDKVSIFSALNLYLDFINLFFVSAAPARQTQITSLYGEGVHNEWRTRKNGGSDYLNGRGFREMVY